MHAWGPVDLRIYLAKKNHGYSISAQSYDVCPRVIKLDIPDFTLSHMEVYGQATVIKSAMLEKAPNNTDHMFLILVNRL